MSRVSARVRFGVQRKRDVCSSLLPPSPNAGVSDLPSGSTMDAGSAPDRPGPEPCLLSPVRLQRRQPPGGLRSFGAAGRSRRGLRRHAGATAGLGRCDGAPAQTRAHAHRRCDQAALMCRSHVPPMGGLRAHGRSATKLARLRPKVSQGWPMLPLELHHRGPEICPSWTMRLDHAVGPH